jgi:ATP-dependent DNA ligase
VSRNGFDSDRHFAAVFEGIAGHDRAFCLDGEIAAPNDRGGTKPDDVAEAMQRRGTYRLAFFASDLPHLDGEDLRGRPLIERKAALADRSSSDALNLLNETGNVAGLTYLLKLRGGGETTELSVPG